MALSLFTKLITTSRTIKNSGYNKEGQLENKDKNIELFIKEPEVRNVYKMDRSTYHTMYILSDKTIYGVGYNGEGQLGIGSTNNAFEPTKIILPDGVDVHDIIKVVCGGYHTFLLHKNGDVYGTGYNHFGQLGYNGTTNKRKFDKVNNISNVKDIKCGGYHTFFITYDNNVYACGKNDYGQLGLSSDEYKNIEGVTKPTLLNGSNCNIISFNDLKDIYCGGDYTLFLFNNGDLYGCGYNGYGQLGTNSYDNLNQITKINHNINHEITTIQCGSHHTLILLEDGNVYGSGSNMYGQLGLGNKIQDIKEFTKLNIADVKEIVTDAYTSLFLVDTDEIYGCGHNKLGELGLGDNNHRYEITKLLYNDIWLDSLAEDIINVPKFNFNKKVFIVDGLFLTGVGQYIIILDKNLLLKVFNKDTMEEVDRIGFYIDKGKLKYTKDEEYLNGGYRNYFTETFYETCNYSFKEDTLKLEFTINNKLFSYDTSKLELTELKENEEIYTGTAHNIVSDNRANILNFNTMNIEADYKDYNNSKLSNDISINNSKLYNKEQEITNLTYINNFNNKYDYIFTYYEYSNAISQSWDFIGYKTKLDPFSSVERKNKNIGFIGKDKKYYKLSDVLKNYNEFLNDEITKIYYFEGKIYLGSNSGQLWVFYYVYNEKNSSYEAYCKLLKKFKGGQIVSMKIKKNNNSLTKKLIIDNNSSYLNIGFSDGRIMEYKLYREPLITFKCTGIYFLNNKVYYNLFIKIENYDLLYHNNLKFIVHNNYNEKEIFLNEFDSNLELKTTVEFENLETINYSYIRLNYSYGNNCLGTVYEKLSTIKINMIYSHDRKIFANLSNYSSYNLEVILQSYNNINGEVINLQSFNLSNFADRDFLCFDKINDNIEYINLISRYDDKEFYLLKHIKINDIELLYNNVSQTAYNDEILLGFDRLVNSIYENKNVKDIPLEQITSILNALSHKKYESIRSLPKFKNGENTTEDIYGNYLPLFNNSSDNKYIVSSHPKNVRFRDEYRINAFINGIKVPYKDISNSIDRKNNSFISYIRNKKLNSKDNIDISMYSESLILSEKEIYKIKLNKFTNIIDKLLSDEGYKFTIPITSEYIDNDYLGLYVKFRHGVFWSRINDKDYHMYISKRTAEYTEITLKMNNEIITTIGDEIHICLHNLDKRNEFIFKDTSKNEVKLYKNYYIPLLSLDDNGNVMVYYVDKSENVEIFVDGHILVPYVDYKVLNFPLHLQVPTMILFRHPIADNKKIEVSILKENYIDSYVKDYRNKKNNNKYNVFNEDAFKPMLANTFDLYINGSKIPSEFNTNNRSFDILHNSNIELDNRIDFVKFYLEDNDKVKFLITLLSLKLRDSINEKENYKTESDVSYKELLDSLKENNTIDYFTDIDEVNDGLLYFLYELIDKSIINNKNPIIDCNDNNQLDFGDDILLDGSRTFRLPYITENIAIDTNIDYSKDFYNNDI